MPVNREAYQQLTTELNNKSVTIVAVSKTKPANDIAELYQMGHRDFGENYVQEMVDKQQLLPGDIRWHFIGHLQTNKVKYIIPFAHLIHGVDSLKLLKEIDRQAQKTDKVMDVLLQVHIAQEATKFGLNEKEIEEIFSIRNNETQPLRNVNICGLMGMASFTDNKEQVRKEFRYLKTLFDRYAPLQTLSMGMSDDYTIAVEEGSTMVRIGSLLFGERTYPAV